MMIDNNAWVWIWQMMEAVVFDEPIRLERGAQYCYLADEWRGQGLRSVYRVWPSGLELIGVGRVVTDDDVTVLTMPGMRTRGHTGPEHANWVSSERLP
jgi:hypothetical protein